MSIDIRPLSSWLFALAIGAAAGACTINTGDGDDGNDDGDICHTACEATRGDCEDDCNDGDDVCVAQCIIDFDECERDCD